jgi:hypothetical protein
MYFELSNDLFGLIFIEENLIIVGPFLTVGLIMNWIFK